eukprot:g41182.t1
MLSPVFWFHRLESSALSVGLNRGKAQPMFRWADGISVERTRFVADARTLLARTGVDDGTRFNGISLQGRSNAIFWTLSSRDICPGWAMEYNMADLNTKPVGKQPFEWKRDQIRNGTFSTDFAKKG